MAKTAQERLAEVKQKTAQQRLAEIRGSEEPEGDSFLDMLSRNIAQPFNEGLMGIPELLPGGDDLRQTTDYLGMTAPEGQGADNFVADSMEVLGGSALPAGGLAGFGRSLVSKAGKTVAPAVRGPMQEFLVQASKPGSLVGELMAALGAGPGGQIAEEISDDPNAKLQGQLVGGLTPAGLTVAGKPVVKGLGQLGSWGLDQAEKLPLTGMLVRGGRQMGGEVVEGLKSVNPYYRASRELQGRYADPVAAAADIDPNSPMPPARQTGGSRPLALDENLRAKAGPAEIEKSETRIAKAVEDSREAAIDVGGDTAVPRRMIQQDLQRSIKDAEDAVAKIDPDADFGDLSAEARLKIEDAQKAARSAEELAWNNVGFDSPGNYDNTSEAIDEILSKVGRAGRNKAIPKEVLDELEAAAEDGAQTTLKDIHALRQIVQGQKGAAQLDPEKRGLVRWLTKLETALLDDMESVAGDPAALKAARKATMEIYDKFRRGKLGQVLGSSERSTQAVVPRDTLENVFSGKDQARSVEQLINAAPEVRDEAEQYVRNLFMHSATKDGKVQKAAAERLIGQLKRKRMFEIFPDLEKDFADAVTKGELAATGKMPGEIIPREYKQSLSTMFLDQPVGKEAGLLLDSKLRNSAARARQLLKRMKGNPDAEDGLRQSFREAIWDASAKGSTGGVPKHNAELFSKLVNEHESTMRALGFGKDDIANMRRLATMMRQADAKPLPRDVQDKSIMTDIPGRFWDRVARLTGAKLGAYVNRATGGGGAGTSLQAAQMGAGTSAEILRGIRMDPAERLLLDAMDDPELFRSLLLRDGASAAAKKKAAERLNTWLVGVGLMGDEEEESEP